MGMLTFDSRLVLDFAMSTSAPLLSPPLGWRDCSPSVGEPIHGTNLILCKAVLSQKKYNIKQSTSNGATSTFSDASFTPSSLIANETSFGRRIHTLIELSIRTSSERAAGVRQIIDTSNLLDAHSDLISQQIQFVHFKVDLTPTSASNESTTDPLKHPCPIDPASITAFVTLLRGLVVTSEKEHEKRKAENANATVAATPAAAASSSSSSSTSLLSPHIYLCDSSYGFNLPGFLVACYLTESCGLDIMSSINDIADSRPPGVYIATLLQGLVNRYFEKSTNADGVMEEIPIIPDLPRPDFHQVPWTGVTTAAKTSAGASSSGATQQDADGDAAMPGETFKRKARKKATPAPAMLTASSLSSFASSPAAASISSSSSYLNPSATAGIKRAAENGADEANKRTKLHSNGSASSSSAAAAASAAALSNVSAPFVSAAPVDPQRIIQDHNFLIPLTSSQVMSLRPVLNTLLPSNEVAELKCGRDLWSLLAPPSTTQQALTSITSASAAAASSSYSLSWLPTHSPCLLLLQRHDVYAIFGETEKLWFRIPNLSFPKRKSPQEMVNNTLLLGELIRDPVESSSAGGQQQYQTRFLVTDLLVMSQTFLPKLLTLDQRLQTADVELIQPLKQLRETRPGTILFHIRCKMQFSLAKVESVLNMRVPHGNDGVIVAYNGKTDVNQKYEYKSVWRRVDSGGVSIAALLALAQMK